MFSFPDPATVRQWLLDIVREAIAPYFQSPTDPFPSDPPTDGEPTSGECSNSEPRGFQPREIEAVSAALRSSGAYAAIGNQDAFLGSVFAAIQARGDFRPTSAADIRVVLDAAMVGYSDADGDGAADLPYLSDDVVNAFWAAIQPILAAADQGDGTAPA